MHPPSFSLSHTVSDWPECHLELGCPGCGKVTIVALKMLTRDHGGVRVLDLVSRLRCQECRVPASPVHLCASPRRRAAGGGHRPDWAIELVPAPAS